MGNSMGNLCIPSTVNTAELPIKEVYDPKTGTYIVKSKSARHSKPGGGSKSAGEKPASEQKSKKIYKKIRRKPMLNNHYEIAKMYTAQADRKKSNRARVVYKNNHSEPLKRVKHKDKLEKS